MLIIYLYDIFGYKYNQFGCAHFVLVLKASIKVASTVLHLEYVYILWNKYVKFNIISPNI